MDKFAFFYVSLFFLGVGAVLLGVAEDWKPLIAIGSAFIGTSIGGALQRTSNKDFASNIIESLQPGLSSPQSEVKPHKIAYYLYHVTRIDGEFVWRSSILDFSKSLGENKLTARLVIPNPNGQEKAYAHEAAVRQERLFISGKAEGGSEAASFYMFPFGASAYRDQDAGFLFHQTYDSTHSVSPAILSESAILDVSQPGSVPKELQAKFDSEWNRLLKGDPSILPRVWPKNPNK